MGKLTQPGPGMFPLILSVLLCTVTDGLLDYSLPLSIWTLPLGLSFQMVGFGDPLCDFSTSNLVFFRENSYSPSTHGTLGGMITFKSDGGFSMELKLYLYFKKKEVSVMKKKNILLLSVMVVTLMWMSLPVAAAEYPTRAITIINPYPPGGTLDIQSRAFAAVAEKLLGQPVVVVNKAGATGMIGSVAGAQAAPDGYTLTTGSTANSCAIEWEIANGRKPPVTNGDFVTIGSFTMSPTLVVVPYNSPWKTVADLINDCKAKPDHYAFSLWWSLWNVPRAR